MRFLAEGPSIPDDLLLARDEGRVVFFCGAGVSRSRAGLPDFWNLARKVINKLGVQSQSPAQKLLEIAKEISERSGIDGLVSADRVFGFLERDFLSRDIETVVAQALKPVDEVNLSAHRILLDLAKSPDGKTKIVTTNFDRLFEACDDSLKTWCPPDLPDPICQDEVDGIVHLHGMLDSTYSNAEGNGLILSSSAFGQAYLAEGWATEFFRKILNRWFVVFVGYTADDPPVHYLLEALNKQSQPLQTVYAFQSKGDPEAFTKWKHKGVIAIPYGESDAHENLWNTLEAWADRAINPETWYQNVIALSLQGPERLQPHERGQVAHVVSTFGGIKHFSEADNPPPAEWLCVFDSHLRYTKPGFVGGFAQQRASIYFDPFYAYGLDSDIVPPRINPDDHLEQRNIPSEAWDGFYLNNLDRKNLNENQLPVFRGPRAVASQNLPVRLNHMGAWLAKVADQPASVWWAAHQKGLHPDIQNRILWKIGQYNSNFSSIVRQAWQYLFEAWETTTNEIREDWFDLRNLSRSAGWNSPIIRKFASLNRPYHKVENNYFGGPKPPELSEHIKLGDMVLLDVEYPNQGYELDIPGEWVPLLIREFRKNLELAVILETELGGFGLRRISPIEPDLDPTISTHTRTSGLSGTVIYFSSLFEKLIQVDQELARQEFAAWPVQDETIFGRLRLWASGKVQLFSNHNFLDLIMDLSDAIFWKGEHQRDLLLVLTKRWNTLDESMKKLIEKRLIAGPPQWESEEEEPYKKRKAWATLDRLYWMHQENCEFTFDIDSTTRTLQQCVPEWNPSFARGAASSTEPRGGRVTTNTNSSALLNLPLNAVLLKAEEIGGRIEDFLIENDPFAGLSEERPILAFRVLTHAAKQGQFPSWAWRNFFQVQSRERDPPKFMALIAQRIFNYPNEAVADFIYPISDWLLAICQKLASQFPAVFDQIVSKLITVLRVHPLSGSSGLSRGNRDPDWGNEALNAPVGKIAQALMKDPRIEREGTEGGFPSAWLAHVNNLLGLQNDLHRHALVIFTHYLDWFFGKDPHWTDEKILSILDQSDVEDKEAIWSGFLGGGSVPSFPLYRKIKFNLLEIARSQILERQGYVQNLAATILIGWEIYEEPPGETLISAAQMREVLLNSGEEFRLGVLSNIKRWERENERWEESLERLFRDVWPRQISARTSRLSARLFDLAIENPERFTTRVDLFVQFMVPIERGHFWISGLLDSQETIIDEYPEKTLALLYVVLPGSVSDWPHGIEELLNGIVAADSNLRRDMRWQELFGKWNSR